MRSRWLPIGVVVLTFFAFAPPADASVGNNREAGTNSDAAADAHGYSADVNVQCYTVYDGYYVADEVRDNAQDTQSAHAVWADWEMLNNASDGIISGNGTYLISGAINGTAGIGGEWKTKTGAPSNDSYRLRVVHTAPSEYTVSFNDWTSGWSGSKTIPNIPMNTGNGDYAGSEKGGASQSLGDVIFGSLQWINGSNNWVNGTPNAHPYQDQPPYFKWIDQYHSFESGFGCS